MNKKTLIGILLAVAILCTVYFYIYKNHRDISTETAAYSIVIPELEKEFAANEIIAIDKYQNKTIEITAQITAIDPENKAIILDGKVFATFNESLPKDISKGQKIKIKGRFLGYDELLEEFKIDQSSILH